MESLHGIEKCFNLKLVFGKKNSMHNLKRLLEDRANGYCCFVDINVLAMSYDSKAYKDIIDGSLLNFVDGSSLAFLMNIFKRTLQYHAFSGPEVFAELIHLSKYKQVLLGPNDTVMNHLGKVIPSVDHLKTIKLPFVDVEEFDYETIASEINRFEPTIIWVLLGAPKQEQFIKRMSSYSPKGLFMATGAALNLFLNNHVESHVSLGGLRFIWLKRLWNEPKKQIKRLLYFSRFIPRIILSEIT